MPTLIIKTERDFGDLLNAMKLRKLPLTVTYQNGKHRTEEQNRLQRAWCNEIAEQLGDRTAEDVRGLAKLTMGVPILRAENDEFREKYDRILRPLPYEAKLECMTEPLDFPVTRLMNVSQKVRYLDHMHRHFLEMGLELTQPDERMKSDAARYRAKMEGVGE